MTLLVGIANRQQVILVSDRRLSNNGVIVEDNLNKLKDESNKAAIFICQDARLAVAFTGFAQVGGFSTRRWFLEALSKSAQPDYLMEPTIKRLCNSATKHFSKYHYIKKSERRLSIVLAGYDYNESPPRCCFWLVSNFEGLDERVLPLSEASDEFQVHVLREKRPSEDEYYTISFLGATRAVKEHHFQSIQTLLRANKPPNAIIGKTLETLYAIADSPLSGNTIGKQCTSIILPSDASLPPITQYHSNKVTSKVFEPSFIEARGDEFGVYTINDARFESQDSSGYPIIVQVPKVGRNDLCPCGSGERYKRCHGQS